MNVPLREAIQEVQQKIDSNSDVLRFVARENGDIIYASQALEDALAIKNQAMIGEKIQDILTVDNVTSIGKTKTALSKALTDGKHDIALKFKRKTFKGEFQFDWISMPNKERFLVASTESKRQASEEVTGLLFEVLDTQTKTSKKTKKDKYEKNRLQELEMAHFMDISPNLMAVIEEDGSFVRFNKNFVSLFGYAESKIAKSTLLDLIVSGERTHFKQALLALREQSSGDAGTQEISVEALMCSKTKKELCVEWTLRLEGDAIFAFGKDVTQVRAQAAELKVHSSQLSEAQALAKMGHWRWMMDGGDIFWSDELYNIFEQDPESFKPSLDNITSLVHRRDLSRMLQGFQRAIIEKRDYDIDFRIIGNDGSLKYIRCEGRCETDEEGDVISLFGILQDVTERMHYIVDLRKAKESAEQAYASKSRFLANMSHELRTPLNAIIGFSEMMQRQLLGPIGSERYLDYITGIRESGEHLLDLISDILDMSKIEAGKYELVFEEVSVSKIIKLAIHMMEGRATESDLSLKSNIKDEDITISADRRAIMQILLNLLSNAIKFTENGGEINIATHTTKNNVVITVKDTGIGIPANRLSSITKPFEQADYSYAKEHEGSGLGLAITKDLAEMHGGRIAIDSKVGRGTTVTVKIPHGFDKNADE